MPLNAFNVPAFNSQALLLWLVQTALAYAAYNACKPLGFRTWYEWYTNCLQKGPTGMGERPWNCIPPMAYAIFYYLGLTCWWFAGGFFFWMDYGLLEGTDTAIGNWSYTIYLSGVIFHVLAYLFTGLCVTFFFEVRSRGWTVITGLVASSCFVVADILMWQLNFLAGGLGIFTATLAFCFWVACLAEAIKMFTGGSNNFVLGLNTNNIGAQMEFQGGGLGLGLGLLPESFLPGTSGMGQVTAGKNMYAASPALAEYGVGMRLPHTSVKLN